MGVVFLEREIKRCGEGRRFGRVEKFLLVKSLDLRLATFPSGKDGYRGAGGVRA